MPSEFEVLSDAELMAVPATRSAATDAPAVVLELVVEAIPGREQELLNFLALAFPFYESQGGHMILLRDEAEPRVFRELGFYASEEEWAQVDRLAREDPRTGEVLRRWRALLSGPPRMRVLRRVRL